MGASAGGYNPHLTFQSPRGQGKWRERQADPTLEPEALATRPSERTPAGPRVLTPRARRAAGPGAPGSPAPSSGGSPLGCDPESRPPPLPRAGNSEPRGEGGGGRGSCAALGSPELTGRRRPRERKPSPRHRRTRGRGRRAPGRGGREKGGLGRPRCRRRRNRGQPLPRAAGPGDPRGPTAWGATPSHFRGPRPPGRGYLDLATRGTVSVRRNKYLRPGRGTAEPLSPCGVERADAAGPRGSPELGDEGLGNGRPEVTAPSPAGQRQVAGPRSRLAHLLLRPGELLLHVAGKLPRRHPLAAHLRHRVSGLARCRAPRSQPRPPSPVRLPPRTGEQRPQRRRGVRPGAGERDADRGRDAVRGRGRAGPAAVSLPARRTADAAF